MDHSNPTRGGRVDRLSVICFVLTLSLFTIPFTGGFLDDFMPEWVVLLLLLLPPGAGILTAATRLFLKFRRRRFAGRALDWISALLGVALVHLVGMIFLTELTTMSNQEGLGLLLLLGAIEFLCLWVWMIVDCIRQEREDPDVFISWLVSLLVFSPPATLVYLIGRKSYREKGEPDGPSGAC